MLELRDLKLLHISSPVTSVAFSTSNELYVGSEDGSVRLYDLTSTKVVKAVSKLGGEVSGIIPTSKKQNKIIDISSQVWIASGNMVNASKSHHWVQIRLMHSEAL
jgi:WD40 repeat protein